MSDLSKRMAKYLRTCSASMLPRHYVFCQGQLENRGEDMCNALNQRLLWFGAKHIECAGGRAKSDHFNFIKMLR